MRTSQADLTADAAPIPPVDPASTTPADGRFETLLRTNWLFAALLLLGVALRVMTWLAYQPALIYTDSFNYLKNIGPLNPQFLDPIGYPLFVLKPLIDIHGISLVTIVQHLAGIGMALLLYRTGLNCGAKRWLAALVTAPVLLDGYQLQIEQEILSDVWLEVLLVVLLWLLIGRGVPSLRVTAFAGLVIGLSMTVRMVAIAVIVPAAIYVVLVGKQWRVPGGWRKIAARFGAMVGIFVLIVAAYGTYFDYKVGYWALSTADGNSLYGRTAEIADCPKLDLDPVLAQLCPKEPFGQRLGTNTYAHLDGDNPNWPGYVPPGKTTYDLDREFAKRVVEKQPLAVARAILADFGKGFLPVHWTLAGDPPGGLWQFQTFFPTFTVDPNDTKGDSFAQTNAAAVQYGGQGLSLNAGLAGFLHAYQLGGYTPGPLLGALLLLGLIGGLGFGRARRSGLAAASLLTAGVALTVLGTAAIFEFSWRYQLPGLVLLPLAGALGFMALTGKGRTDPPAEPEPAEPDVVSSGD
jgi:hypothetical protein